MSSSIFNLIRLHLNLCFFFCKINDSVKVLNNVSVQLLISRSSFCCHNKRMITVLLIHLSLKKKLLTSSRPVVITTHVQIDIII